MMHWYRVAVGEQGESKKELQEEELGDMGWCMYML